MTRSIGTEPTAILNIHGFNIGILLKEARVARIELPLLSSRKCREKDDVLRIDINVNLRTDGKRTLEELAEFLMASIEGSKPIVSPKADLSGLSDFSREVLESVSLIPWGETRSYGWVAKQLGNPGAARAVGKAVSKNPVPILVPCHRVTRSDGGIGGWSGKPGWKRYLLELEYGRPLD